MNITTSHSELISKFSSSPLSKIASSKSAQLNQISGTSNQANTNRISDVVPMEDILTKFEVMKLKKGFGLENYSDILKNPERVVEENQSRYNAFLQDAEKIVKKLESLDTTKSFDIKFGIGGAQIQKSENYDKEMPRNEWLRMQSDRQDMLAWIDNNRTGLVEVSRQGREFAFANAYIEYRNETGFDRNIAIKAGKVEEYTEMVYRYAVHGHGTDPMTPEEIKQEFGSSKTFKLQGDKTSYTFDYQAFERAYDSVTRPQVQPGEIGTLINTLAQAHDRCCMAF